MPVDLLSEYAIEEQPASEPSPRKSIDLLSEYEDVTGPSLAYPPGLENALPTDQITGAPIEAPGVIEQVQNIPKVFKVVGAETGLTTVGGFEAGRAQALRDQARSPVGFEGRLIGQAGVPRTPEARLANAIDRANVLSSQRAEESAQYFLNASTSVAEDYGLDPKLETGLITQATRGLAKGAGMYALAASGGIPALAIQGSTEAFGAAKQAGKSDDEADKEATRALIGLAIFGGANKAVASGIAKYLGNAAKLRTFLVQTLGQTAGNEATSRAISAYEAALDAEPGKRADAAVEAISRNDPATIAQNVGFALMGGMQATKNAVVSERNALRLEEVASENIARAKAEQERTDRIIAEQNAAAARLGEQRQASGAEFVQPSPEALSPEIRARAEGAEPIVTGAPVPSAPQQGPEEQARIDIETGTVQTPDGKVFTVDESGATEVVPGSPKDVSMSVLVPKEAPEAKGGEQVRATEEIQVRESVPEEPEGRTPGGQAEETSPGDRVQRAPESIPEVAPETPVEAPPGPPAPPEAPAAPVAPVESPSGIRNARVDAARIQMGLPPRMEPLRRTFGQAWEEAMQVVESNPQAGSELVADLVKQPRALTPTENALLAHEQVTRENRYNEALKAVNEAPNEAARRLAEASLTRAREQNQEVYDAGQRAGTESGQSLAFRKLLVNRDYSLAAMEAEVRALKGGTPLSEKDLADVKALHDRIKVAEERALKSEEKLANVQGYEEWLKLSKLARRESSAARAEGKSILDRMISNGDAAMERIRKRSRSGRSMMSATLIDPIDFVDYVQVGAGYLARGVKTVADFTSRLVGDFGDDLAPHGERIFNASQKFHQDATATAPRVRTVQEAFGRDKAGALDPQVVYDVARAHVNAGVLGFEPVMQATTATMKANHPDLIVRQVRDAFSGYGKVTRPSQAEDRVKLREYRRLGQLASAIEDAQRKIAPMKSGAQRDKATEAVRAKMAELKRVMQENGIEVTSPEQQLANAERTATTRLQNTIESLERQIAAKTRDEIAKGRRVSSPELEALRERVESLRKTLDEVAPKSEETDAQKVQRSIESAQKRIATLDEQLRTGEKPEGKPKGPTSPELERIRAERDAMSKLVRELAQAEGKPLEQRKLEASLKAVDKQIAELDRQLKTGDVQVRGRDRQVTSPALDAKRAERDAMRSLRDDIRALARPRLTPEQRAVKAVRKSIEELDRQIREGDIVPRGTPRGPSTPELDTLRAERDSMRSLLKELRDAGKTKRSPEEVALSRYKSSLSKRTKDIQDRIARGDYARKARRETALDAEALASRFEYQKAKDAFEQKAFEYDLSRRSGLRRAYDTALEVLNTSRAIITSFDVSAPLRQGAFITLAHPIRSAKNLPAMFRAFASEKAAFDLQESLSDPTRRPNAGQYRQSGLDLTETGGNVSRRKLEEAYQSRLIQKIPTLLGGGLVRGSQRAYTVFLNQLRADSFDAMVKSLGVDGKVTPEEGKAIANFINTATGRAKYGETLERSTELLNAVFFAPKYVASRFKLIADPLTGFSLSSGTPMSKSSLPRVRKQVAKEYARFLAGTGLVLGLSKLAGAGVEDDPRSSDFGKIKIGNTRLDLMGGLSQVSVLLSRLGSSQTKDLKTGRIKEADRGQLVKQFLLSKLSPAFSFAGEITRGKDIMDRPVTTAGAISGLVVPMSFGDIMDAMVEQGVPRGAALSLLSLFGASMSTFEAGRREREAREPWEELQRDVQAIQRNPMEGRRGLRSQN